jgi:DNA-binding LytR/AlgR family response regulator
MDLHLYLSASNTLIFPQQGAKERLGMLDSNGRYRKTGASAGRNIEFEMDDDPRYHRPQRSPDRIAVRQKGRVLFVTLGEIDWIEAADNYVCLHCADKTHVLRETMSEVEARLASTRFIRIHRSAIVNIDRIRELQPWFRGDYQVILHDGTKLTLTKNHRGNLDSQLVLGAFTR